MDDIHAAEACMNPQAETAGKVCCGCSRVARGRMNVHRTCRPGATVRSIHEQHELGRHRSRLVYVNGLEFRQVRNGVGIYGAHPKCLVEKTRAPLDQWSRLSRRDVEADKGGWSLGIM